MTALELRTTAGADPTVIAVIGPITTYTAATLREHFHRVLAETTSGTTVQLDLGCCTNLDADGAHTLDLACREAARHGGNLHLVNVPRLVARLIRQYHVDHLLRAEPRTRTASPASRALRDVPEADVAEQRTPIAEEPDHDSADEPLTMTWDTNPADLNEQRLVVPAADDDYEPDR